MGKRRNQAAPAERPAAETGNRRFRSGQNQRVGEFLIEAACSQIAGVTQLPGKSFDLTGQFQFTDLLVQDLRHKVKNLLAHLAGLADLFDLPS